MGVSSERSVCVKRRSCNYVSAGTEVSQVRTMSVLENKLCRHCDCIQNSAGGAAASLPLIVLKAVLPAATALIATPGVAITSSLSGINEDVNYSRSCISSSSIKNADVHKKWIVIVSGWDLAFNNELGEFKLSRSKPRLCQSVRFLSASNSLDNAASNISHIIIISRCQQHITYNHHINLPAIYHI